MALTDEQFEALVKKLETASQANPKQYRTKVALLAVLGYAYIFFMLGLSLSLLGVLIFAGISGHFNAIFIKLAIVLVILIFTILRSMWVTIPAPQGIPLTPQQTPALFTMLDSVSTRLSAPKFHHVLLVDEFNAAVAQVPRLGILGWQVNYLLLGLPLMQSVTPEEFESVIAHEMGHLSGNHSRFSGWVYRVRQTWMRLLTALIQQGHKGAELFTSFFKWYAPYFSAYSYVLTRANEYEADRCAAEVATAQTAARALLRIPVQGRLLSDVYWPSIYEQCFQQPEPPTTVFANLVNTVQQPVERAKVQRWVAGALHDKTDIGDTHPSLTDRLASLGFVVGSVPVGSLQPLSDDIRPVATTAADTFLGPAQTDLTAHLDHLWRQSVMNEWRKKFVYAQDARKKLDAVNAKGLVQALTVEELLNQARWTAELMGNAQGIPLIRRFVEAYPNNAPGNFLLGQCLIEEKDESGVMVLERAMSLEPDATIASCGLIYGFLHEQGRFAEADRYLDRAKGRHRLEEDADDERSTVTPHDAYWPHGLDPASLPALAAILAGEKDVAEAFLVRKAVTLLQDKPLYVVGLVIKAPWYKPEGETAHHEIAQRLAQSIELPGQFFVLVLEKNYKPALARMRAVPDSVVYFREKR